MAKYVAANSAIIYNIANRNSGSNILGPLTIAIPDQTAFSVHARALPGAPIDPTSGLPIPTVAIATSGGTSIIHPTGFVANLTGTNAKSIFITPQGRLRFGFANQNSMREYSLPYSAGTLASNIAFSSEQNSGSLRSANTGFIQSISDLEFTSSRSVQLISRYTTDADSLIGFIGPDYTTGWMPPNTAISVFNRGAVGLVMANTAYSDLGDDVSSWNAEASAIKATVSGEIELTQVSSSSDILSRTITTSPGQAYIFDIDMRDCSRRIS